MAAQSEKDTKTVFFPNRLSFGIPWGASKILMLPAINYDLVSLGHGLGGGDFWRPWISCANKFGNQGPKTMRAARNPGDGGASTRVRDGPDGHAPWPAAADGSAGSNVCLTLQGRKLTGPQRLILTSLFQGQNLPFGIPSLCCSFENPLKVAFKAWDIISLLLGVNSGTSAHSISGRKNIPIKKINRCWIVLQYIQILHYYIIHPKLIIQGHMSIIPQSKKTE